MQVLRDIGGVELPDSLIKLGADGERKSTENGAHEPTTKGSQAGRS